MRCLGSARWLQYAHSIGIMAMPSFFSVSLTSIDWCLLSAFHQWGNWGWISSLITINANYSLINFCWCQKLRARSVWCVWRGCGIFDKHFRYFNRITALWLKNCNHAIILSRVDVSIKWITPHLSRISNRHDQPTSMLQLCAGTCMHIEHCPPAIQRNYRYQERRHMQSHDNEFMVFEK